VLLLYFLHGYKSSPTGEKALLFQKTLQAIPLKYRDGAPEDLDVNDALRRVAEAIRGDKKVGFIGSSLGGYLAAATALDNISVTHVALLNPAIIPPGFDVSGVTGMPQHIVKRMINPNLFSRVLPARLIILRGTQDTEVPDSWVQPFARAQHAKIFCFKDDHRFTNSMHKFPEIFAQFFGETPRTNDGT
jgi:predicted esterase YcpF (UPF0227 family)